MIQEMPTMKGEEIRAGEAVVAVSYTELARLREIAGCFQDGDAAVVSVVKGMLRGCGVKDDTVMMDVMNRAQAAAKLAEDSRK